MVGGAAAGARGGAGANGATGGQGVASDGSATAAIGVGITGPSNGWDWAGNATCRNAVDAGRIARHDEAGNSGNKRGGESESGGKSSSPAAIDVVTVKEVEGVSADNVSHAVPARTTNTSGITSRGETGMANRTMIVP